MQQAMQPAKPVDKTINFPSTMPSSTDFQLQAPLNNQNGSKFMEQMGQVTGINSMNSMGGFF